MHLDLRALGFDGSYDRVAAFARQWKVDQLERVNSASKSTPIELAQKKRRTEDAILDIRENTAIAATYVSYEKTARELGESGKPEFFLISTDKHMHQLELARREEEQALQKRYWTWKLNLFTSQVLEKAWSKLVTALKKKK